MRGVFCCWGCPVEATEHTTGWMARNAQADAHLMRARIEGWRNTALAQKLSSRPKAGDQHRHASSIH